VAGDRGRRRALGLATGSLWLGRASALLALLVGLGVTAALSLIALGLYHHNENRLLGLRVKQLALVLSATEPAIETPLASAGELARATNGDARRFQLFAGEEIAAGRTFQSLSLWPVGSARPAPIAYAGQPPAIAAVPATARAVFGPGTPPGVVRVVGLLSSSHPTLGFVRISPGPGRRFAVYAESLLPASRRSRLESNNAFSDLNYVLYLGRSRRLADLLLTSVQKLPLSGHQATATVPYGGSTFSLVVAAKGSLAGTFFRDLPAIIAVTGALLTLSAAFLIDRLARRRHRAEELASALDEVAAENRRMYMEQRGIAETLQHALLPEILPEVGGLRVAARYVPAARGSEVGGDWYDVAAVDGDRVVLIIGDVSGHGIEAATTMALVRHATLAYALQDPRPATVLSKLAHFVNARPHGYFATVLCVLVEVGGHTVHAASAGHLPPLVVEGGKGRFVDLRVNPPVGVPGREDFDETVEVLAPGAGLVAFTDGLVERRGEVIDTGLERLRASVAGDHGTVDALVARLVSEFVPSQHSDDTAIVGIEWPR
jgi:serine phosphatase RsbU (regulator of sigma subunit)